jgi:hypothetical protein
MKSASVIVLTAAVSMSARADVVYSQPHDSTGTLRQSSWMYPDGSDYDWFIWDSFIIPAPESITEIRWRGGYLYGGMYSSTVPSFTIAIYPSIAANTEPDVVHPPLVEYQTGNDANETPAGVFGGTAMYDYTFTMPVTFQAEAGVKYWLHIYADQSSIPEWGFASGSGGNGAHFRRHSEYMFQMAPGDCAFAIVAEPAACGADIDANGTVGINDLLALLAGWGGPAGPADVDGNGIVNVNDLLVLLASWGACP